MFLAGIAAIGGGLLGAYSSRQANSSADARQQAAIEAAKGDPRAQAMLYGDGSPGSAGLLGQYQGLLGAPQSDAMKAYGTGQQDFLANSGAGITGDMHQTANNLMGGNVTAPGMGASYSPQTGAATAASVSAPAQNGMNLSGSYDHFINGDAGANPYLTKAIGGALDQSTNQFRQMQGDATDNLMRNVMPSIRSNSVLSGQYGGSRQGIAEGNAISDFTKQQAQAMTQFGQNNTIQAVGAQATAFGQGQDRALSATQGLGAQQYGVAAQNSTQAQQAELANKSLYQNNNQFNAGLQQDAAHGNLSAQLSTDQLNTGRQTAGIAANSGLLGTAYATGQNQDNHALNQATQVNGLLQPYLSQPGATVQPTYQGSTAGGLLGGALGGVGLYNQFRQANGSSSNILGAPTGSISDLFGSGSGGSVFGSGGMWGNG